MSWSFDVLKGLAKIEYLENSHVLGEMPKSREKARIQCPVENINRGVSG